MVLAGTRKDTEYEAVVTQLRSAWIDQDLRDGDSGGKSIGKMDRTIHFAEAVGEWYAEQIAHSTGDGAELEATGLSILMKPSGGVVCWTRRILNLM